MLYSILVALKLYLTASLLIYTHQLYRWRLDDDWCITELLLRRQIHGRGIDVVGVDQRQPFRFPPAQLQVGLSLRPLLQTKGSNWSAARFNFSFWGLKPWDNDGYDRIIKFKIEQTVIEASRLSAVSSAISRANSERKLKSGHEAIGQNLVLLDQ